MNTQTTRIPALVMEHEAARYLGVSVTTLHRDRTRPVRNIPVVNIGSTVRYSLHALDEWISRCGGQGAPAVAPSPAINTTPEWASKRPRGRPRKKLNA